MKSFLITTLLTILISAVATAAPVKKKATIADPVAEENSRLELAMKAENSAIKSIDELAAYTTGGAEKWDLERRRGESYLKLSRLYRLMGNNKNKTYPETKDYLKKGQDVLVKLLEQRKDPALSLQLAVTYKEQELFDKSLKLLNKVSQDPDADAELRSEAYFHEGEVYFDRKNFASSLKSYEKVDPTSSIYGFSRYKKAWSLYNLKRNRQAVEELTFVYKAQKQKKGRLDLKDDLIGSLALFSSEDNDDAFIYELSAKNFDSEDRDIYLKSIIRLLINHGEANRAHNLLKNWTGELTSGIDFYRSLFQVEILLQQKKYAAIPEAISSLMKKCEPLETTPCRNEVKEVSQKVLPTYKNKPALLAQLLHVLSDYNFDNEFKTEVTQAYAIVSMDQKNYDEAVNQWRKVIELIAGHSDDKAAHEAAFSGLLKAGEFLTLQKVEYKDTYVQDLHAYLFTFPTGKDVPAVRFRLATTSFEKKNYTMTLEQLDLMKDADPALKDPSFDLRIQAMYELKKWDDVEKILTTALNDPATKNREKYEDFLDRLSLRKSAEAKDTQELISLFNKTKKLAIKQDIYRLVLSKAQKKTTASEMSFLLRHLPQSGLSESLKKETFQFLIFTAYKKDAWKDLRPEFQTFMRTGHKFVGNEEKVKFAEMDMFYSGDISSLPDCSLAFKFEVACKLALVRKNDLKGVFDWSKRAYSQNPAPEKRRWIRYIQAQVLKAEFLNQSIKTTNPSRKNLLLTYKAEKLEKTLTALLDTLQMPAPVFFKYQVAREIIGIQEDFLKELEVDPVFSEDKNLLSQFKTQIGSFRQKVQEIDDLKKINAAFENVETRYVSAEKGSADTASKNSESLGQLYKWIGLGTQKLGLEQTSGLISSWRNDERQFERILLYLDI